MKITIEFDEKKLINEIVENLPEYSLSLRCVGWNYKKCEFKLVDEEDDKPVNYLLTYPKLKKGLKILFGMVTNDKLKGVANTILPEFQDAGYWDANAVDCLIQCSLFGDVIYG